VEGRPNILFLFCDQLRADALGCYGNPFARTPALDRLAASGVVFNNAYTPSPVCVAARSSLITGQEPQHTGCFDNGFEMPADRPTLMSCLTGEGYRTHGIGKMHFMPHPYDDWGFETRDIGEEFGEAEQDHYLRFLEDHGFGHVEKPHGLRSEMYYVPQLSQVPEHLHYSHWVADRSIEFIRGFSGDRPFFLWSSFIHPHPPFAPPAPWHKLYPPMLMSDPHRPEGERSLLSVHNLQQNRYKFRDGGYDRRLLQLIRAYYFACLSFIDAQIGRIVGALEETGRIDNTLIVFSSDHGEFLGDYGCFGKRSFLDVAARVPLICVGLDPTPSESDDLASLIDLMPTFLEIAGGQSEDSTLDGLPLQRITARDAIYGQFQTGPLAVYMVLTQDYKYIYSVADQREYLIDRRRDPHETRNIAYNSYCRDGLLAMRRRASEHFDELTGVDFDDATHNTPMRLGGPPDSERFESLAIDEDAGGLILPDALNKPEGEPYDRYWRYP
jgi:arylsulfatase